MIILYPQFRIIQYLIQCLLIYIQLINSCGKSDINDEEIIDDEDEDDQMPQVPQTLEKKMPQMNKYFSERNRTQSESGVQRFTSYQSFTEKSLKEIKTLQAKNKVSRKKIKQKKRNKIQKKAQKESKQSSSDIFKNEEQNNKQIPDSDPFSSPDFSFIKRSSNDIKRMERHPIFDTPGEIEQSLSSKDVQTPPRPFQQDREISTIDQSSLVKQCLNTESTQSSLPSNQKVTVFQAQNQNSMNSTNQCGSNINAVSNTSFSSNYDHNISQISTKPSDLSISDNNSLYEVEEMANKLKRLQPKERKMKEFSLVKEWNKDKHNNSHIIDVTWAVQYTSWLSNINSITPFNVPISNLNLIDQTTRTLKTKMKEKVHYDILSTKVYFLLKHLYGGGPDIAMTKSSRTNDVVKSYHHQKQQQQGGSETSLIKQSGLTQSSQILPNFGQLEQNTINQLSFVQVQNYISQQQIITIKPQQIFKKAQFSVKGLHNQSNYCYLNASIQCFLSIPELNSYFLSDEYKTLVKIQDTRKALRLVPVYADMVKLYEKASEKNILDMSLLKKAIRKPFIPHEQHDAQELIRYILSEIQDELNPNLPTKHPNQFEDPESAYKYYLKYQNSIIDMIFSGQISSSVECNKCGYISKTFDPFLDLSLGMDQKTQTITDCLNKFFTEEILSEDYKCEKCNQNNKAKKQVLISKTPYILTLHLKRFKIYPKKKKITDFIKYPSENLSLRQYLKGNTRCGGCNYNLIGIIVHAGNQDSGHYVSFVKRDNRWFYCDDSKFQEVSEKTVLKQEAYLLFFQRVDENIENSSQIKKPQK